MHRAPKNRGIIRLILIIVAVMLLLGYFNIDLKKEIEKPVNQQNAAYVKDSSMTIWNTYLEKPVKYFWNTIFINLLWNSFVANMERIRDGQPTDLEQHAPTIAP